jgi:hypothetical protein
VTAAGELLDRFLELAPGDPVRLLDRAVTIRSGQSTMSPEEVGMLSMAAANRTAHSPSDSRIVDIEAPERVVPFHERPAPRSTASTTGCSAPIEVRPCRPPRYFPENREPVPPPRRVEDIIGAR